MRTCAKTVSRQPASARSTASSTDEAAPTACAAIKSVISLIPFGIVVAVVFALASLAAQDAPPRDQAAFAVQNGQFVTATTDLPLYQRNRDGNYVHAGVLFGGVTVQVTGATADGHWWRVPCGDGSEGNCWVTAEPNLLRCVEPNEEGVRVGELAAL